MEKLNVKRVYRRTYDKCTSLATKAKIPFQDLTRSRRKLTAETLRLSKLCSSCEHLLENLEEISRIRESLDVDQILKSLQNGRLSGCHLCTTVFHSFSSQRQLALNENLGLRREIFYLGDCFAIDFYAVPVEGRARFAGTACSSLLIVPEDPASDLEHFVSGNTNSEANWKLASTWLQKCLETHGCAMDTRDISLPTRLLDVGAAEDSVRLCVTSALNNAVPYVTLSHCWGLKTLMSQNEVGEGTSQRLIGDRVQRTSNSVMPMLKVGNLQEMQQGIPFDTLSRTFQEAILITRRLGFRYLWIDSLCIIQDSKEDWERESVLMSSVYSGSQLNIAATSARSGAEGCFRDRNPDTVQPGRFRVRTNKHGERVYNCVDRSLWTKGIEESPLCSRGWVLQERLLAPRVLHFGESQLFWECNELCACETLPNKLDIEKDFFDPNNTLANVRIKRISSNPTYWENIIMKYSRCSLTMESDKLIAISGVAKSVQNFTHDKYFAGLWRRDIERQLLWYVDYDWRWNARYSKRLTDVEHHEKEPQITQTGYRPQEYRAPSWSWASVGGVISRFSLDPKVKMLAEVVDVNITHVGPDVFSQVQDGVLSIRSIHPLKEALLIYREEEGWPGHFYWDIKFGENGEIKSPFINLLSDVEPFNLTEVVYLMAIYDGNRKHQKVYKGYTQHANLQGLILVREHQVKGQYRRLGIFRIWDYRSYMQFWKAPITLDESCYDSVESHAGTEEKMYQITII